MTFLEMPHGQDTNSRPLWTSFLTSTRLSNLPRLQNSPYVCVFKYARAHARKILTPRFSDFFTDFEKKKNRLFYSLQFTSTITETGLPSLDTNLHVSNNRIQTFIHYKETDSHNYLYFFSFHTCYPLKPVSPPEVTLLNVKINQLILIFFSFLSS